MLTPTEVDLPDEGDELIWLGWAEAIGRKSNGTLFNLSCPASAIATPARIVVKIIGGDNALAYLDASGHVHVLPRSEHAYCAISQAPTTRVISMSKWADVAASETAILGLTPAGLLFRFTSLEDLLHFSPDFSNPPQSSSRSELAERVALPPLSASTFRLYALETRLFVHVAGAGMQQLLELVRGEDDLGQGLGSSKGGDTANGTSNRHGTTGSVQGDAGRSTRLVQIEVDALNFTVVPGPKNRLGVLCDTGEAYLLDSRTRELERLEVIAPGALFGARQSPDAGALSAAPIAQGTGLDDDDAEAVELQIHLLGIGSGHEVLIREDGVWTRGENNFGQLGNGQVSDSPSDTSSRLPIDAERVTGVFCSRWTTVVALS